MCAVIRIGASLCVGVFVGVGDGISVVGTRSGTVVSSGIRNVSVVLANCMIVLEDFMLLSEIILWVFS